MWEADTRTNASSVRIVVAGIVRVALVQARGKLICLLIWPGQRPARLLQNAFAILALYRQPKFWPAFSSQPIRCGGGLLPVRMQGQCQKGGKCPGPSPFAAVLVS